MSLYRYRYKLKKLRSSPGLTGRPSIPERQRLTESLRRTGSPAFAGDDAAREWSAAQIALSLAADTIEHGRTKKSAGALPRRIFSSCRARSYPPLMTARSVPHSTRAPRRPPRKRGIQYAAASRSIADAREYWVARSSRAMTATSSICIDNGTATLRMPIKLWGTHCQVACAVSHQREPPGIHDSPSQREFTQTPAAAGFRSQRSKQRTGQYPAVCRRGRYHRDLEHSRSARGRLLRDRGRYQSALR